MDLSVVFLMTVIVLVIVLVIVVHSRNEKKAAERKQQLQAQMHARELETKRDQEQGVARWQAEHSRKRNEAATAVLHDRLIVLDVETQQLSTEVAGGWDAVADFLVAVAVTWDQVNGFRVWYEQDVVALLAELNKFTQILTYNGDRFDFKVLSHYGPVTALKKKSVDLLAFIKKHTRKCVSLDVLAKESLGVEKNNDRHPGSEPLAIWRSGKASGGCRVLQEGRRDSARPLH